ncbi:MAG: hypothetical protein RLY16_2386 [Bacteroidota bacterium]
MHFLKKILKKLIAVFPIGKIIVETGQSQTPVTFKIWWKQKVLGYNKEAYWPMHFTSRVSYPERVFAGIDTSPGYMNNCYIQGYGRIYIGDYTQIAPGVGLISSNHDVYDSRVQIPAPIHIGKYCWIGMNAVILPGVILGDYTIVAAGAVVSKSFPDGYCVIGGVPAMLIKHLDKNLCVPYHQVNPYNGYIRHDDFERFKKAKLDV